MDRSILERHGINYTAGLRRFMEDEDLYNEMLTAFLADKSFAKAFDAFNKRDYSALFEQAHVLKGASGSLDMTELYQSSSELAELLRHNKEPDEASISVLFDKMQAAYYQVIDGVRGSLKAVS